MKFIVSERTFKALHAAGFIDVEPANVRRCVIDLQVGEPGRVYCETFADERLMEVALLKLAEAPGR